MWQIRARFCTDEYIYIYIVYEVDLGVLPRQYGSKATQLVLPNLSLAVRKERRLHHQYSTVGAIPGMGLTAAGSNNGGCVEVCKYSTEAASIVVATYLQWNSTNLLSPDILEEIQSRIRLLINPEFSRADSERTVAFASLCYSATSTNKKKTEKDKYTHKTCILKIKSDPKNNNHGKRTRVQRRVGRDTRRHSGGAGASSCSRRFPSRCGNGAHNPTSACDSSWRRSR